MRMSIEKTRPGAIAVITFALVASLSIPASAIAKDELTLRVNDAIGEPGGLVALVVRTYASKPVGQGQVCFRALSGFVGGTDGPFASIEGSRVFSKAGDAVEVSTLDSAENGQIILLTFSSDSATVNKVDGPLAVIYLRLREDLEKGQKFVVRVDEKDTLELDEAGEPVPIEGRSGRLTVRGAGAAYRVEADGDEVAPGEVAELGVETLEPFLLGSGQIGLRYDATVATGRPIVRMDKRHGARRFAVDRSTPGLVVVTFVSKKGTLNSVPGQIVSVRVPTSTSAPVGHRSLVTLDPGLTWFFGPDGEPLPIVLKKDRLELAAE